MGRLMMQTHLWGPRIRYTASCLGSAFTFRRRQLLSLSTSIEIGIPDKLDRVEPASGYDERYDERRLRQADLIAKKERLSASRRYYLKSMNCPHHHKLFAAVPRSYRDLPLRLAEYGTCYRYEQSGELFGLMRVRSMQMNDAHIYCTEEQFEAEFRAVNDMYLKYFKIFGIEKYVMRFSTHDPAKLGPLAASCI